MDLLSACLSVRLGLWELRCAPLQRYMHKRLPDNETLCMSFSSPLLTFGRLPNELKEFLTLGFFLVVDCCKTKLCKTRLLWWLTLLLVASRGSNVRWGWIRLLGRDIQYCRDLEIDDSLWLVMMLHELLPLASAVKEIESVPSVWVSVCVCGGAYMD